jgi:hypothetical protein
MTFDIIFLCNLPEINFSPKQEPLCLKNLRSIGITFDRGSRYVVLPIDYRCDDAKKNNRVGATSWYQLMRS